ncbi:MAG: hypothetical protein B6I37_09280 [Desulfobacteraceae bacterium 4572_35.2]|nr:MAG: hypothetical protein B6I37_09280 [Desulfobacteraceae bacterium 4572_35.2]
MATVITPSLAPWLTGIGASTHDVFYSNNLNFEAEDGTMEEIIGLGITPGYGPATVVYAGDFLKPGSLFPVIIRPPSAA